MDTSLVSSLASGTTADDAVSVLMLRKAMTLQAQGAMQLLAAAAPVPASNPPHLGQNIDVKV
jgi:hypothetical protein